MAWKNVEWYMLGYNIVDKQGYVYYFLEGETSVYQLFVTAEEMLALADMFRNEGPVSYNTDAHYFVTDLEKIAEGEIVGAPPIPQP